MSLTSKNKRNFHFTFYVFIILPFYFVFFSHHRATLALLVPLALLVKMGQRVLVVMPAHQVDLEMLDCVDPLDLQERKESLERKENQ